MQLFDAANKTQSTNKFETVYLSDYSRYFILRTYQFANLHIHEKNCTRWKHPYNVALQRSMKVSLCPSKVSLCRSKVSLCPQQSKPLPQHCWRTTSSTSTACCSASTTSTVPTTTGAWRGVCPSSRGAATSPTPPQSTATWWVQRMRRTRAFQ